MGLIPLLSFEFVASFVLGAVQNVVEIIVLGSFSGLRRPESEFDHSHAAVSRLRMSVAVHMLPLCAFRFTFPFYDFYISILLVALFVPDQSPYADRSISFDVCLRIALAFRYLTRESVCPWPVKFYYLYTSRHDESQACPLSSC